MKHILLAAIFFFAVTAHAQSGDVKSLKNDYQKAKSVEDKVKALNSIGEYFCEVSYDSALVYYKKAYDLSLKNNYDEGIYNYAGNAGSVYIYTAQYDKMKQLTLDGLKRAKERNDKHWVAHFTTNLGNDYLYIADYEKAIKYFQEGLTLFQQNNEPKYTKRIYNFIAVAFLNMGNLDKSIQYSKQAADLARKENAPRVLADALSLLGSAYIEKEEFDKAEPVVDECLAVTKKESNDNSYYSALFDKSRILSHKKAYKQAIATVLESNAYNKKRGNLHGLVNGLCSLAEYYQLDGQSQKAIPTVDEAIAIAKENKMLPSLMYAYDVAATVYNKSGRFDEAYGFLESYRQLSDSLNSIELKTKLAESDAKFQNSEKQRKIESLEVEKSRTKFYMIALGVVLSLLLISGFLLYRYMSAKRKNAEQQIIRLQQEKQIVATQNMLEGEKIERTRLARDLHDGLGGMLSGVKFQLNSMKGNVVMTDENAQAFSKSLIQLDDAIAEMRRVAHNMMPESLLKFGLDEAVSDLCSSVTENSSTKVFYEQFGLKDRLEQTVEITLFRIIQELLNNIIKHSGATEAHVQISRNGKQVSLTVEDNGKGFDTAQSKTGIGLANVKSRADYLNGTMDIRSDEKGTSVHLEFDVK